MSDLEFKDQPGSPANQQAKKLAKESAKAAKNKKSYKHIYTEIVAEAGLKIVQVTAKPTGSRSVFIAKKPKQDGTPGAALRLQQYEALKASYKKEKSWFVGDAFDEKLAELISEAV